MYCAYKHTCPNRKVYIGITCQKPERRWNNGYGYLHNKHFYSAIKKYGWENIRHEIIYENLTQKEAFKKEIELISKYQSNNSKYGYNKSIGGDKNNYGRITSIETKNKISKTLMGHYVSDETRLKMSVADKGRTSSRKGKHLNEATKEKLRQANLGKKHTEETLLKMSYKHKKENLNIETYKKMCLANKKISKKRSKKVICIEKNIIYESINEAQRQLNAKNIYKVLSGERKTANGYHFKFV